MSDQVGSVMQNKGVTSTNAVATPISDAGSGTRVSARERSRLKTINVVTVWVGYALVILCNAGFQIFELGGTTVGAVSDEYFAWFTPAGYVFSIWSVIYVALAVWLVSYSRNADDDVARGKLPIGTTALLFALSCALNIAWLALWQLEIFIPSIIVIAGLLVVLGMLFIRAHEGSDRLIDTIPFSLYFAWMCLATVANIAHVITRFTGAEFSILQPITTIILAVAFFMLGFFMKLRFNDYAFGAVVIWAVIGIGVHIMQVNPPIAIAVFVLVGMGALVMYIPWDRYKLQIPS